MGTLSKSDLHNHKKLSPKVDHRQEFMLIHYGQLVKNAEDDLKWAKEKLDAVTKGLVP